jgi:hypothetical protein
LFRAPEVLCRPAHSCELKNENSLLLRLAFSMWYRRRGSFHIQLAGEFQFAVNVSV